MGYRLIDNLAYNSYIENAISEKINVAKKYVGFKTCDKILSTPKDVKGVPYICSMNISGHDVYCLKKVIPKCSESEYDNSMIEIGYLMLFHNEIALTYTLPNIPCMYSYLLNVPIKSKGLSHVPFKELKKIGEIENTCNILICEYYNDRDIDVWCENNIVTEAHWKSMIFQVCITMHILQDKFKFMHNDLHPGNILIDKVDDDTLYYIIEGVEYKLTNTGGYIAKLWDFEFSNVFDEKYTEMYTNPIYFEIGYNRTYDIHNFLKGLLQIESLPNKIRTFIDELYPEELIYSANGKINTSDNTDFLYEGVMTPTALAKYIELPTPETIINNSYFAEYKSSEISEVPSDTPVYKYNRV